MNPKKPLGPNEYEEDGIVYVKDDTTGWKYFDEGGTLSDEDEDEQTPTESDDSDEDL